MDLTKETALEKWVPQAHSWSKMTWLATKRGVVPEACCVCFLLDLALFGFVTNPHALLAAGRLVVLAPVVGDLLFHALNLDGFLESGFVVRVLEVPRFVLWLLAIPIPVAIAAAAIGPGRRRATTGGFLGGLLGGFGLVGFELLDLKIEGIDLFLLGGSLAPHTRAD